MTKEIEVGSLVHDLDRRSLLTGAAVVGVSAALVVEAKAQLLETGDFDVRDGSHDTGNA